MLDAQADRARFCSRCGQPVMVFDASFCKECGAPLSQPASRLFTDIIGTKPLIAAALSIVPGLGHFYRGFPLRGMLWFFGVLAAYVYGAQSLGFILHLVCAANAATIGMRGERRFFRGSRAGRPRVWSGS